MSIFTKLKKDTKPLFPRKFDNSILDRLVKFIDSDTKKVNYLTVTISKEEEPKKSSFYECQSSDDDFEGDYLGEVELKLEETSLEDAEKITYENEEDLFKKIVLFLQKSTENYMPIDEGNPLDFTMPLEICIDQASCYLYDKYNRGEITTFLCNKNFEAKHTQPGWPRPDIVVNTDCLPDNLAIGLYQSEDIDYDVTVLGYINKKEKWVKLKLVRDNIVICFEDK